MVQSPGVILHILQASLREVTKRKPEESIDVLPDKRVQNKGDPILSLSQIPTLIQNPVQIPTLIPIPIPILIPILMKGMLSIHLLSF